MVTQKPWIRTIVSGLVLTGASAIAAHPSLVDPSTLGRSRLGGQRSACDPRCGRIGRHRRPGPRTGTGLTVGPLSGGNPTIRRLTSAVMCPVPPIWRIQFAARVRRWRAPASQLSAYPSGRTRRSKRPTPPARRLWSSSTASGCCRAGGTVGCSSSARLATRRSPPDWPDDPENVQEAGANPDVLAKKTLKQVADHTTELINARTRDRPYWVTRPGACWRRCSRAGASRRPRWRSTPESSGRAAFYRPPRSRCRARS
jgi:hypothetical protein